MDQRHFFRRPGGGDTEPGVGDGGRVFGRDPAHGKGHTGDGHELARSLFHVAVGIEAFKVLTHHNQIDRLVKRPRHAGMRFRRPDIGPQRQSFAQHARGVQPTFRNRRIGIMRHRTKDHAIGGAGGFNHRVGDCRPVFFQRGKADFGVGEGDRHAFNLGGST